MKEYLLRPYDWADICLKEAAADNVDPVAARAKIAEANRYLALAQLIDKLNTENEELRTKLNDHRS